jgi:hypothetical protein
MPARAAEPDLRGATASKVELRLVNAGPRADVPFDRRCACVFGISVTVAKCPTQSSQIAARSQDASPVRAGGCRRRYPRDARGAALDRPALARRKSRRPVQIAFYKLSDTRHALEITRACGACERVECETRSYLLHDLLHYAVESEAGLTRGFWGRLAGGDSLAVMNDRTAGAMPLERSEELLSIERVVGALTSAAKGRPPREVFAVSACALAPGSRTRRSATAEAAPRSRRSSSVTLVGAWRAARYDGALRLPWP